jgi:ubiquinone/menaquinone biosynthesis C-methylase UbiE
MKEDPVDHNPAKSDADNFPGETAIHYDQFFGPFYFEPYAIEVANRINTSRISIALEIAAGTGRVTRHIRQHIPADARLIASDISDQMLAVAKKKLKEFEIEWQIIDAQQLPFADHSIDLVVCCFGYMFVSDKQKAFAEAFRVLKPGGQFLLTTWDKLENNMASFCARSIATKYLDAPLSESYNLPTSMHNEADIKSLLHNAGFTKILIEKVKLLSHSATAKEAATGLTKGGFYDELSNRNPDWINEIRANLEKELAEKFGDSPVQVPMSALICEAVK